MFEIGMLLTEITDVTCAVVCACGRALTRVDRVIDHFDACKDISRGVVQDLTGNGSCAVDGLRSRLLEKSRIELENQIRIHDGGVSVPRWDNIRVTSHPTISIRSEHRRKKRKRPDNERVDAIFTAPYVPVDIHISEDRMQDNFGEGTLMPIGNTEDWFIENGINGCQDMGFAEFEDMLQGLLSDSSAWF